MTEQLRKNRRSAQVYLLAFLAIVCAGIYATCLYNSVQWIGRSFPGFLLMQNRVVPAAGLPHWSGLKAGQIFLTELVAADGRPVESSAWLQAYVRNSTPGQIIRYTFRRGDEHFDLSVPVMRFTTQDFLLLFVFYLLNGFAFMLVGFVVRVVRPQNPASLAMFFVGACSGLWATTACDLYGPHWFFRVHALMECLMPAAIVHLSLVFPERVGLLRKRPLLALASYALAAVLALFYQVRLFSPDAYVLAHTLATYYLGIALLGMLILIAFRYVRTASMLTKQRIRVLFLGYFAGLLLPALIVIASAYAEKDVSFTLISFFTILWPLSVGYAILKHNFFDIDTVVKRSLYYVGLTSTLLAAYLGVLFVLNRLFRTYAFSESPYFPLVFCLGILVVFNPLRQRIQRLVDRVFFRIRYDFRETVESVSRAMTCLLNTEEIARTLLATVTDTVLVSHGVVALRGTREDTFLLYQRGEETEARAAGALERGHEELFRIVEKRPALLTAYDLEETASISGERSRILSLMEALGLILILPITFKSRMIGLLGVGTKKSGKCYTHSDLDLLETLANQSSVALSNATSYKELQELNENLEGLVEERTAELAESNRKLEASYEKLKELDKLKSQFFSNVGHELRTPLTLSLAPLESILQGEMGELDPQKASLLATIHRNALKLLKLINNLLDFSKIEAGRLKLTIGRQAIAPFLREIVEPFRLAGEKRGIRFVHEEQGLRDPDLELYIDRDRMDKVFANLLSNALKYTPAGGEVRVSLEEQEDALTVAVADTGPGIPADDLPHIFERFYQATAKDAVRLPGTGIGLSLVKEFTEMHGGAVSVESTPGQGTRFTVRLLKGLDHLPEDAIQDSPDEDSGILSDTGSRLELTDLDAEVPDEAANAGPPQFDVPADAPRVLVVEDNPEMRRFVASLLGRHYRVTQAEDGQLGLERATADPPDLIVSDVNMPRMTGVELCRAVKQDEALQFIPFILLTSQAEVQHRIDGFEAGADEYVGKPFNARELLARVRSLLDLRQAQRTLQRTHVELQRAHEELKQTETQLIQSEKMASLGQLVAGVAHELNNPISFVFGNVRILEEYVETIQSILDAYRQAAEGSEHQEELDAFWEENDMDFILEDLGSLIAGCREGATRTKEIVQDLRTFSRLDEAERKSVDLNAGIMSTLNLLSDRLKNRVNVHLELEDLPQVECFAGQINQVFMNLLSNAEQAIRDRGDIWIRSRLIAPDRVEVQVEDSGDGIPPEKIDKIFDPFFTTKPVGKGTGLGLSISYGIVERHGGDISVRSEQGRGTCFTLQLPLSLPVEDEGVEHAATVTGTDG